MLPLEQDMTCRTATELWWALGDHIQEGRHMGLNSLHRHGSIMRESRTLGEFHVLSASLQSHQALVARWHTGPKLL